MLMRIFKLGSHIILFLKNCLNERMFERTEKKKISIQLTIPRQFSQIIRDRSKGISNNKSE